MDTPHDIADTMANTESRDRIVYVRPVAAADLPEPIRAQANAAHNIYAVHAANGDRLALVNGRTLAFALARQHDMQPVHVH